MKDTVIVGIKDMRNLVGRADFYEKLPMFSPLRPKVQKVWQALQQKGYIDGKAGGCSTCFKSRMLRMYGDIFQHMRGIFLEHASQKEGRQRLAPLCVMLDARQVGMQHGGKVTVIP
jgi:hypothetical protein